MFVSYALASLLTFAASISAANVPHEFNLQPRDDGQVHKLFARADVVSEKNGIHAHFEFTGYLDGSGTFIKAAVLKGLVKNDTNIGGGPYAYHIHTNPIPADGDCTKALAHLDPLDVTESLICDPAFPKYCQEGDLSGKHGKFNGTTDGVIERHAYTDDYVRFFPEDLSILGRSVVIHAPNKTRIACGNIISTLDDTADWHYKPTGRPSNYVKNYPSTAPVQPPQVVTPFVGEVFPDLNSDTFKNLPFALANEAISIRKSLNVKLTQQQASRSINGTVTTVTLPSEVPVNDAPPFKGFYDHSWF